LNVNFIDSDALFEFDLATKLTHKSLIFGNVSFSFFATVLALICNDVKKLPTLEFAESDELWTTEPDDTLQSSSHNKKSLNSGFTGIRDGLDSRYSLVIVNPLSSGVLNSLFGFVLSVIFSVINANKSSTDTTSTSSSSMLTIVRISS